MKGRLTHQAYFKVCQAISARKKEFEEEQRTYEKVAKELTDELGFGVTAGNVEGCAKDLGIRWHKSAKRNSGFGQLATVKTDLEATQKQLEEAKVLLLTFGKQLDDAMQKTRKLEAEVVLVRGALNKLYRDLGNVPPAGYPLPTEKQQSILNNGR